jgi:hypothetical protein
VSQDPDATGPQSSQHQGWVPLTGIGVRVRYGPGQLSISWDNGSNAVLRFDAVTIFAQVERVEQEQGADVVQLQVNVHMNTPPGVNGIWFTLLPFPERMAPDVQWLAAMLNAVGPAHEDGTPEAAAGPPADPAPATPENRTPTAASAPVRIQAGPGDWTDDPDWVGLYPTRETERLLMTHADQPATPTEYPQVS